MVTSASGYNSLGYIYMGMDNSCGCCEIIQKVYELIPNEANPYDSYAEFLLMQRRFDESIEQYNKAFQTDPGFATALIGIGNNYIFKKDFKKSTGILPARL
ncbi:MAG: hypothetical protein MZV64_06530 [Ignavibacteriales bacterium]|nr:hypothetical protein [Ignavibacteriales bacterium]